MSTEAEPEPVVDAVAVAAQLPEGLAVLRMETETIMAMAAARKRNYKDILAAVKEQVQVFPEFAERAIYSRPVGKESVCTACKHVQDNWRAAKCSECGKRVMQRPVFASGLSIRAAEGIAEAYGFNSVRSNVTLVNPDLASVSAIFVDYCNGRRWEKNALVSRRQMRRDGKAYMLSDERFQLLCDATSSKVIREVILRSVPPGLRAALEREVRGAVLLDEKRVALIAAAFAGRGVSVEQLEVFLGRQRSAWTQDDRMRLLELDTALKDGETTLAEVFGAVDDEGLGSAQESGTTSTAAKVAEKLGVAPTEAPSG